MKCGISDIMENALSRKFPDDFNESTNLSDHRD